MVTVGQVVDVNGKPQIVESVFNGGYVSRPAQPEELINRSLPSSISPQYNPNSPQNLNSAPAAAPAEVKVLGGAPAAQDEATMYKEGYVYKGQQGSEQVWVRYEKPLRPGTYTSPAGDTWEVNNPGNQTVLINGEPAATFYGGQDISYYTKPYPTREGMLPPGEIRTTAGQVAPEENPFNPAYIGAVNPFNQNEYIITDPRKSFWFNPRERLLFERLPGVIGQGFTGVVEYAWSDPDYQGFVKGTTRGVLTSPETVLMMGSTLITRGPYGIASEMGESFRYTTSEVLHGRPGALYEMVGQAALADITIRGFGKGYEWLKGKIITERFFGISPEVDRTSVINPAADKAPFISETSGYVLRVKYVLGRAFAEDVVGVGKARTAGIIERIAETEAKAKIKAQTLTYEIIPGEETGSIIKVGGIAETKTLIEYPGGLKFTSENVKLLERSTAFTSKNIINKQAAGAFTILDKELLRGADKFGNTKTYSAGTTKGFMLEADQINRGKVSKLNAKIFNQEQAGSTTEYRRITPEVDYMETRSRAAKPVKVPDWLFDRNKLKSKQQPAASNVLTDLKSGNTYEQPAATTARPATSQAPAAKMPGQQLSLKAKQTPGAVKAIGQLNRANLLEGMEAKAKVKAPGSKPGLKMPAMLRAGQAENTKTGIGAAKITGSKNKPGQTTGPKSSNKINNKIKIGTGIANIQSQGQIQSQGIMQRTAQQTAQQYDTAQTVRTKTILKTPGFKVPRPPRPKEPGKFIFKMPSEREPIKRSGILGNKFKLGSEKIPYRKRDRLMPSPIQADVSKALYGKATAPKPTRAILKHATISVPTREQIKHKTR